MIDFYLWLFIVICGALLIWGLVNPSRVYQYPFFMSAIFVSFVLPQAFALIDNPDPLRSDGIERVMLMCCLCVAMCLVGYQFKPNEKFLEKLNIAIDENKLFQVGLVMSLFSFYLRFFVSNTIQVERSAESGNLTGIATVLFFFTYVGYIGFAILLMHTLKYPKFINIVITFLSSLVLLTSIIGGRRQDTATIFLTIGLAFFFVRRYVPPRMLALGAVAAATILIPAYAASRSSRLGVFQLFTLSGDDYVKLFQEQVLSGKILELRNAAVIMDAADYKGQYGYGSSYWNFLIFRFIPAQFLGKDFKSSLQINLIDTRDFAGSYGYSIPIGSTTTGIGDSFLEFSYLGCLFFALQAYFFKHLWISAAVQKSIPSQLFYIGLISPAMLNITHGTINFFPDLLYQIVFLGTGLFYARIKQKDTNHLLDTSNKLRDETSNREL